MDPPVASPGPLQRFVGFDVHRAYVRGDALRRLLAANPAYILRNHRVEAAIRAAVEDDDFAPFHKLVAVLSRPFDDQPDFAHYADPPVAHERVRRTFCGT